MDDWVDSLCPDPESTDCEANAGFMNAVRLRGQVINAYTVAYSGSPTDGQVCEGSKPIGDLVGLFNDGSGQKSEYVKAVNPIMGNPATTILKNSQYATSFQTMGWVYKDADGHYWIQANAALAAAWSASVSAGFLSVGITPSNDQDPVYAGSTLPKLTTGEIYQSCWPTTSNGGLFG
jgi:hypothetical protein